MFSRRSPPQMTPSDRVRQLWTEFEQWHAAQTVLIEQKVTNALQELDLKWRQTPPKKRGSKADHEQRKKTARQDIEKTFNGNLVREEWQNRLDKAGLQTDDWIKMTEAEQKSVERILGADLDLEEMELPVVQNTSPTPSGSLFAPPMTRESRSENVSDNYAFVNPNSFKTARVEEREENSYEPWMQVVHKSRSDDEISLDASTTSSWGFSNGDGPAYLSWSSEASRSSTETSQASSPERPSKYLSPDVKQQQSLLSAAARRLSGATERSRNDKKHAPPHSTQIPISRSDSSNSLFDSSPFVPVSNLDEPQTSHYHTSTKSRVTYIGPHIADPNEIDEETEFHNFKMGIRIQKIREFHDEAALADIKLTVEIDDARRQKKSSKDYEAKLLKEHEQKMIQLRKSKEEERKTVVEAERYKRRAAMRAREATADDRGFEIPPLIAAQLLKGLKETDGSVDSGGASDTPTIRQQQRRTRKPSLHTDWTGGGDTPTPTARVSAWAAHSSHLSQAAVSESVDTFGEGPSLKRGVPDPNASETHWTTSLWKDVSKKVSATFADDTPTKAADISPWAMTAAKKASTPLPDEASSKEADMSPWARMAAKKASTPLPDETSTKEADVSPWAIMAAKKASASLTNEASNKETDMSPWAIMAAKKSRSIPGAWDSEPVTAQAGPLASSSDCTEKTIEKEKVEKVDPPKPAPAVAGKGKKKKGKGSVAVAPEVSPSQTSSSSSKTKAGSSVLASSSTTPDPPVSAKSAKEQLASKSKLSASSSTPIPTESKLEETNSTISAPAWNILPKTKAETSPALTPSSSSSSAWSAWGPTSTPQPIADDRRVWMPATSSQKAVDPRTSSSQTEKTDSTSTPVADTKRSQTTSSQAPASSGILKKAGSSKTKPVKGSKKKQVTIEEVEDKEGLPVPDGVERLPSDSRYIMEPTSVNSPTAPPRTPNYGDSAGRPHKQSEHWAPPERSRSQQESNGIWLPGTYNDEKADVRSKPSFDRNGHPASGMHATWTPSGGSGSSRGTFEPEPGKDLFLSALDSLEAIVRGSEPSREDPYEQDKLGKLISGVGREKNGDGDEALWHAIASFGQRGGAASAW